MQDLRTRFATEEERLNHLRELYREQAARNRQRQRDAGTLVAALAPGPCLCGARYRIHVGRRRAITGRCVGYVERGT